MRFGEIITEVVPCASTSARPIRGSELKIYRVGDDFYAWSETLQDYIAIGASTGSVPPAQFLTLALDATLTHERRLVVGENLIGSDGGANGDYGLYAQIGAFIPNSITATPSAREDNYVPTGWNSTYPSKATTIFLNPSQSGVIGGIQGGADGREMYLVNVSNHLVILENESPGSSSANRFLFSQRQAHFLLPGRSLRFRYSTTLNKWMADQSAWLDVFDDYLSDANSSIASSTVSTSEVGLSSAHIQSGGSVGGTSISGMIGSIFLNMGTTANGNAKVSLGPRGGIEFGGSESILSIQRIQISAVPDGTNDYYAQFGLSNTGISAFAGTSPGAFWLIDRGYSTTNFMCVSGPTGSVTRTDSGIAFNSSDKFILGTYVYGGTSAVFFYSTDGITYTIVATNTTSIINTGVSPSLTGIFRKSGNTTARNIRLDYQGFSHNQIRA